MITVKKIKIPSREKNTENLGRYLAMFTDKIKDVSDPTEMVHIYVPSFRKEGDPLAGYTRPDENGVHSREGRTGKPDPDTD